jgi:hypothetical protein
MMIGIIPQGVDNMANIKKSESTISGIHEA